MELDARTRLIAELRHFAKDFVRVGKTLNADYFDAGDRDLTIADLMIEAADALAAEDWQPIETAPKDGTFVLLYQRVERPIHPDVTAIGTWNHPFRPNEWSDGEYTIAAPSHWQPLPAPPDRSRP